MFDKNFLCELQMATFSLSPHMVESKHKSSGVFSYKGSSSIRIALNPHDLS